MTHSHKNASRPSSQSPVRRQPFMAKPTDSRNPLVVAVVVDQGHAGLLSGAGEDETRGRNAAMIAICRQLQLSSPRAGPQLARHRDRLESGEAIGDLASAPLIRSKARQLQDHQVAYEDKPCFYGCVEPACQLGKSAIAHPGPSASIEKRRSIELKQLQLSHEAQSRSRPAAISCGVPSTSPTTSNPLSTRRRAASKRAALTVSLRPSVPSSRRAASKARSSTSTVVRVMRIIISTRRRAASRAGLSR
jgi:hypothetical protein